MYILIYLYIYIYIYFYIYKYIYNKINVPLYCHIIFPLGSYRSKEEEKEDLLLQHYAD